jgi:hypothetical protein
MEFEIGSNVKIVRSSERFWVEVTAKSDDGMVTGTVNSALVFTEDHGLEFGDEVILHEREIVDVFTSDHLDEIAAQQMAELKAKGL